MSSRPAAVGQRGGRGDGRRAGRGGRRANNNNINKKKGYISSTPAIQHDIFDCGKPEHAALFVKSKKNVTAYIRRLGENEAVLVAEGIEIMIAPTIIQPAMPALIENPNNLGIVPPDMIED